jgi:hypothetical protein
MPLSPADQKELDELEEMHQLEQKFGDRVPQGQPPESNWHKFAHGVTAMADSGAKALTLGNLKLSPEQEQNIKDNPNASLAGEVGGGLASGIGASMLAPTLAAPKAAGIVAKGLYGLGRIGIGTGMGGAMGFAAKPTGDDTLAARGEQAKNRAIWGAGLSALGEVPGAIQASSRGIKDFLAPKVTPTLGKMAGLGAEEAKQYSAMPREMEKLATDLKTPAGAETHAADARAKLEAARKGVAERQGTMNDVLQTALEGKSGILKPDRLQGPEAEAWVAARSPKTAEYQTAAGSVDPTQLATKTEKLAPPTALLAEGPEINTLKRQVGSSDPMGPTYQYLKQQEAALDPELIPGINKGLQDNVKLGKRLNQIGNAEDPVRLLSRTSPGRLSMLQRVQDAGGGKDLTDLNMRYRTAQQLQAAPTNATEWKTKLADYAGHTLGKQGLRMLGPSAHDLSLSPETIKLLTSLGVKVQLP